MKHYMEDINSKNQKHISVARQLAKQMLLTANIGEADCEPSRNQSFRKPFRSSVLLFLDSWPDETLLRP